MVNDDFTYEKPNEQYYFNTLVKYLNLKREKEIVDLLKGAKCTIQTSSRFSEKRWNATWTTIYFYISIDKLDSVNEDIKQKLTNICDSIMPIELGFDVMNVKFSPLITETESQGSLTENLEDVTNTLSQEIIGQILPEDIKTKGRDMLC